MRTAPSPPQREGCPAGPESPRSTGVQSGSSRSDGAPDPSSFPEPPGPRGQRLRNLTRRVRGTASFFENLRDRYGDVVGYRILGKRYCLLFRPDLMEEVIAQEQTSFRKGAQERKAMENDCIITANGADHERRRRLVQPSFRPRALEGYSRHMVSEAVRYRDSLRDGERIDMEDLATDLSLAVAGRSFFGDDQPVGTRLMKDFLAGFRWMFALGHFPFDKLAKAVPLPRTRAARHHIHELDNLVYETIDRARKGGNRNDLVSHLVTAWDQDRPNRDFTESELKDEIFAILIASHVTIAATLTWSVYHLSRHPAVRDRLEQEVDEVLGDRLPGFGDFPSLPYTRAVVDESLRITPPVFYLGRIAVRDLVIGSYRIREGTIVQLSTRTPMYEEQFFREPDRFNPERWLEEPRPKLPRLAYAPFGTGIRFCSGFRFALLELVFALAVLGRRWRFDVVDPGFPPVTDVLFYKCRNGLPVVVRQRENGA